MCSGQWLNTFRMSTNFERVSLYDQCSSLDVLVLLIQCSAEYLHNKLLLAALCLEWVHLYRQVVGTTYYEDSNFKNSPVKMKFLDNCFSFPPFKLLARYVNAQIVLQVSPLGAIVYVDYSCKRRTSTVKIIVKIISKKRIVQGIHQCKILQK